MKNSVIISNISRRNAANICVLFHLGVVHCLVAVEFGTLFVPAGGTHAHHDALEVPGSVVDQILHHLRLVLYASNQNHY